RTRTARNTDPGPRGLALGYTLPPATRVASYTFTRCADSLTRISRTFGFYDPERAVNFLLTALSFQVEPCIHARIQILEFFLQLHVAFVTLGVKRPVGERLTHRATRFVLMPAVGEITSRRNRFHIRKRFAKRAARVPQLKLSHSGRVDQQSTSLEHQQLAMRRRVPAAAVVFTHLGGLLDFFSNYSIDQCRLPRSG